MDRVIKFRAWDKSNNRMHPDIWSINWDFKPNQPKALIVGSIASNLVINEQYVIKEPNFVLLQSTGLKDKNGVEIYEGDVLKESSGGIFLEFQYEVIWDEKWATFKLDWTRVANSIQYPGWNRGIEMEIIGNVYLNPELLINDKN